MDKFTYVYGTTSNRLLNVADAAGATSNTDDIEPGQVANNYQYDLLGQLIKDIQEGIVYYDWRLSDRKLRSITGASTKADVNFIYNPFGQRVVKIVKPKVNGVVDKQSNWIYTYYSYDANGQVMAVYDCKLDGTNATLNQATLKEQHLYGSQRLGMVNKNTLLYQSNTAYTAISPLVQNTYGNTNYELTNHLGNVNAVITDRRFWNATTFKHEAGVEAKNDYYPFGMEMPLRQSGSNDYRFGYNGMELDNEVSGNGNSYTTEFRQYDPRLGRWKSLDPLMAKFPWQSPYCAMNNNPISLVDPTGQAAEDGDNEDWIKKEGSSQWEFDSEVQSPEKAKELYGANTQYKDVGESFSGQQNGVSVGDVNLGENGKMTWGNGHQATVADNAQTRLPTDGGYSTPNSPSLSQKNMYAFSDFGQIAFAGTLAAIGTGGISLEAGAVSAGINGGVNLSGQLIATGGDWSKVDVLSVAFSTGSGFVGGNQITNALVTSGADALFDYSSEKRFSTIFGNNRKSLTLIGNDMLWNSIGNLGSASFGKNPAFFEAIGAGVTGIPTNIINTTINNKIDK
jgi:RHS repeat-associated protein